MKNVFCITGFCALAACGGSGDGSDVGIVSSGVLQNIEIPTAADLADVPEELRTLVDDFRDLNENNIPTSTLPPGTANFNGMYGVGLNGDDNDTVIYGDMALAVNFGAPQSVTGTVSNLTGLSDGNTLVISNSLDVAMSIDGNGNTVAGSVSGTVMLDSENYVIDGSLDGGFGGQNAEVLLGLTEGTITNPDSTVDSFEGYWATEK